MLADLKTRKVRRVLAFPVAGKHPDGDVWTGPAALFEAAGFKVKADAGDYPIMELVPGVPGDAA